MAGNVERVAQISDTRYEISDVVSPPGMIKNFLIVFPQQPDKLEFVGMRRTIPSPGGKVPQCAHWGG